MLEQRKIPQDEPHPHDLVQIVRLIGDREEIRAMLDSWQEHHRCVLTLRDTDGLYRDVTFQEFREMLAKVKAQKGSKR